VNKIPEVNEEIVRAYFEEFYGYVARSELYFKKKTQRKGKRKGVGPSDIDLVLMHPKKGKFGKRAIVAVKGWQNTVFNIKDIKNYEKWYGVFDSQEIKKAKEFFSNKKFNKIFVVSKLKKDDILKINEISKKLGIIILDFPRILKEIWSKIDTGRNYKNSEFLQAIRLAKKYINE